MTHRLEDRLENRLEMANVAMWLIRRGQDTFPAQERLAWIRACIDEAIEIQKKIDKRNRKRDKA